MRLGLPPNVSSEEAALVCGGRLFHARAAATGNARSYMSISVQLYQVPACSTDEFVQWKDSVGM